MGAGWAHLGTSILASFLASLVECVEALTVVLAVGSVRGWRSALIGSAAAIALLLLFGLRWLRKAILRSAGLIPLHDEQASFAENAKTMRYLGGGHARWDKIAFAATFNITMLEGTEVVFIVIAIGTGHAGMLLPASLGAVAALLVVIALGLILHRPLARIPENALKFVVGVLLSAFGTFWAGEGMKLSWPGADWSIPALVAAYLLFAVAMIPLCRSQSQIIASSPRDPE
jgi:uncharacterized membrane protein